MATRFSVPGRQGSTEAAGETKVIRTTDSPNCTGACGWLATVGNDVIIDSKRAADYPCEEYMTDEVFLLRTVLMNPWYEIAKQKGHFYLGELVEELHSVADGSFAASSDFN